MSFALAVVFSVIAVAAVTALLVLTLTVPSSPLCIRRRITAEVEAPEPEPAPEPKIPRDTSRTYPRPKGSRSKLNRVCPVCGTGSETGDLDGRVLGWPAHWSCAEWLGDWKPPRPEPPPYKPDVALIGYMERGQKPPPASRAEVSGLKCDGCGALLGTGVRYHDTAGHRYCPACDRKGYGHPDRQIVSSFTVTPMALEEHTHKVGDPLPTVRCACGAVFVGPPGYLTEAMKIHRQVGCRQSSSSLPA